MANSIFIRILNSFQNIERAFLFSLFGRNFPPPAICCAPVHINDVSNVESKPFSLKDLLGDGFLYAVPKHRRTVQKRLNRKFGWKDYLWKPLVPKRLSVCNECGHHQELGVLCPNCYKITMTETKEMQDKIQADLGLSPVDKEVIVLYEGEKIDQAEEFWKNKRIVEMPKERPPWFSKNLLQKTMQKPATSTDVEPSELA